MDAEAHAYAKRFMSVGQEQRVEKRLTILLIVTNLDTKKRYSH